MATVDCVAPDHVDDFVVFVRGRTESTSPGRHIVEEILNGDLCALPARHGLRLRCLARFGGDKFASIVKGPPGTIRVLGPGGDCQMGYMADACQGLAAKAICSYG